MEAKGTYAEFVDRMLNEVDFLEAPKASERLEKMLEDSGLAGMPIEEVRKHTAAAIAKYERMIEKELRKRRNITWKDAIQELNKRRSGLLAREQADRCLKIRKLLREGICP